MARQKKKYICKQRRGGTSPNATATEFGSTENKNRSPKDYHRQKVAYHGGEMALEKFEKNLKELQVK